MMRIRSHLLIAAALLALLAPAPALAWLTYQNFPQPSMAGGRWTPPQTNVCTVGNGTPAVYIYSSLGEPMATAATLKTAHETWNNDRGSEVVFTQRALGATVMAGEDDVGRALTQFAANERHDNTDGNGTYNRNEGIYQSTNATVQVGDTRLSVEGFTTGSVVAAGDPETPVCTRDSTTVCGRCSVTVATSCTANTGCPGVETCQPSNAVCIGAGKGRCNPLVPLVQFQNTERHDNTDGNGTYNRGERIYSADNHATVQNGDTRLFICSCQDLGDNISCVEYRNPWAWGGSTLAVTTVEGPTAGTLDEFDMCINGVTTFNVNGGSDLETTLLHELGHGLGLDHPDPSIDLPQPPNNGQRPNADYQPVVMVANSPVLPNPLAIIRRLTCDDKAGANFLCPPQNVTIETRTYRQANTGGCDFGDAPDPKYPTLAANNGARHKDSRMEWLGPISAAHDAGPPYPQQDDSLNPSFEPKNDIIAPPPNGFVNEFPGSVIAGQTGAEFANGSTVAGGNSDVGTPVVAFAGTERHADRDGNNMYDPGEAIYDVGGAAAATVQAGHRRLTAAIVPRPGNTFVTYPAGSTVRNGDRDIGTPLAGFGANERHTGTGAYSPDQSIYRAAGANVANGDTRLKAPATPARTTFEVGPLLTNKDELDDGVSLREPLVPGLDTLVDIVVQTSGVAGRYADPSQASQRLFLNGWEDWNGDGDWKDWTTIAGSPPLLGPGGTPPCTPAPAGEEYAIHWQGNIDTDQFYTPAFCGGRKLDARTRLLTFVIRPPAASGMGPQPVGTSTMSPFYQRFRLDYGEDVGQNLRDFSDPTLVHDDGMGNRYAVSAGEQNQGIGFDQGEAKYGEVEDYVTCMRVARRLFRDKNFGRIINGTVLVSDTNGQLRMSKRTFASDGTWLVSDRMLLNNGADVGNIAYNDIRKGKNVTVRGTETATPPLPLFDPFPPPPTVVCGGPSIVVPSGTTSMLPPGMYDRIEVQEGATLIFEPGTFDVCSIQVDRNASMEFDVGGQSTLNILGKFRTLTSAAVEPVPGADAPIINVAGTRVVFGQNTLTEASLNAPAARLVLGRSATYVGSFLVDILTTDHSTTCACTRP